jgi:hypothetical protein
MQKKNSETEIVNYRCQLISYVKFLCACQEKLGYPYQADLNKSLSVCGLYSSSLLSVIHDPVLSRLI